MPADTKKKMIERTAIGLLALAKLKVADVSLDQLLAQLEADEAKRAKIKARLEARAVLMLNRKPARQAVAA